MKDEIKEILDGLEKISTPTGISYSGDVTINNNDVKILKDYITYLQEKYERLYNENCKLREQHNITDISLLDENEKLKIDNKRLQHNEKVFKSRNEKAIEFNQIVLDSDYVYSQDEIAQKNINILNGGDE